MEGVMGRVVEAVVEGLRLISRIKGCLAERKTHSQSLSQHAVERAIRQQCQKNEQRKFDRRIQGLKRRPPEAESCSI